MEVLQKMRTFNPINTDSIKILKHSKSMKTNVTLNNKLLFKNSQSKINNENNENNKKNSKRFFFAYKVDLNDKMGNFYKKGINTIFNKEEYFFETKYLNHQIRIGNGNKTSSNTIDTKFLGLNKKIFTKKKTRNFLVKNTSLSSNQIKTLYGNSFLRKRTDDSNMSVLSKYDYKNPTNNSNYIKRPSIFLNDKQFITDNELKSYFHQLKAREEAKKSRKNRRNFENNLYNFNFNTSLKKEINNRICLQEKILKNFKKNENNEKNIENRLIKLTKKNNKDFLLIKQVGSYRNKIEKINKNFQKSKSNENYNKTIQWLSSLRQYDDKNNTNNTSENNKEKEVQALTNNKEEILDNYINKLSYSFGNNTKLYSDIESNITPLYALIIPSNNKNNETIKSINSHDKNSSPIIIGKNLLNYEIELCKYLEGKKKLLIKRNYHDDDIKPLIFSETTRMDKYTVPGSVTNAFELHFNNK